MNKKKLLILNGSHSEIPLIQSAKKIGFHVVTTGKLPDLIGHQYADEYFPADYSNKEDVLQFAENLDIDRICSCANDFGATTAAYVSEKMGLSGHDTYATALLLHQKDSFKKLSLLNDLPTPHSISFLSYEQAENAINSLSFPVIIKPVDLTGGKGVAKVDNVKEYLSGIAAAFDLSREKRIVVEDFFIGTQHSFSSFIVDKKVVFSFSDNEYSYKNPYYVSTSSSPAHDIDKYSDVLIAAVEKIAELLDLVDGVFHIQFLANGIEAKIIDITRRCSGDLYSYPVNYSTNIDWAEWLVRAETGQNCSMFPKTVQSGYSGRHCVMAEENGTIRNVIVSDELKPFIHSELFWWQPGDIIDDYLVQKVGIIVFKFNTKMEMDDIVGRLPSLIRIELDKSTE